MNVDMQCKQTVQASTQVSPGPVAPCSIAQSSVLDRARLSGVCRSDIHHSVALAEFSKAESSPQKALFVVAVAFSSSAANLRTVANCAQRKRQQATQ